jgi:beta-galactosidase
MIEQLAKHYGNDSRIVGWQLDNEPAVQFDYNLKAEIAFVISSEKSIRTPSED